MSQIWLHRGFNLGGGWFQVGELCPLYWPFWAETARPALTYLQDFDFTCSPYVVAPQPPGKPFEVQFLPVSPPAGCPAWWGGVKRVKHLLGKLPWELGGTSHCSCRAVWGCWLENSGSGSQDVMGTVKTLDCFLHFSAEVATIDLWG